MRISQRTRTLGVLAVATLALGACGTPGSGGGQAASQPTSSSGLATCEPVAGESLVVLKDDKGLQNADNVIPAVNAQVAADHPQVLELLDKVSASMDTDGLIALALAEAALRSVKEGRAIKVSEVTGPLADKSVFQGR